MLDQNRVQDGARVTSCGNFSTVGRSRRLAFGLPLEMDNPQLDCGTQALDFENRVSSELAAAPPLLLPFLQDGKLQLLKPLARNRRYRINLHLPPSSPRLQLLELLRI